jgi:hypothetical protein
MRPANLFLLLSLCAHLVGFSCACHLCQILASRVAARGHAKTPHEAGAPIAQLLPCALTRSFDAVLLPASEMAI